MLHKNIIIRNLTSDDSLYLQKAEQLFQTTGAWGNLQNDMLKLFCDSPTCTVFGAFDGSDLIGCSVAGILGERKFDFYKAYGPTLAAKLLAGQIAHMIASVLNDEYRGQGIGRELLKIRMQWARDIGAKYALANSWVSQQRFNSARLFQAEGFQEVTRLCNLNAQSEPSCINCGKICRCENIVYLKEL